jgi:D-alanyl-D-alanine carboxypeptidase
VRRGETSDDLAGRETDGAQLGAERMSLTRVGDRDSDREPILRRRGGRTAFAVFAAIALLAAAPAEAAQAHRAKAGHRHATKADPDRPPASARPIYESIVIDAATGRVLHQVNADTRAYPASLTKMMTLYMLFDAMKKGKVRLDTPMRVSARAAAMAPSKLDLTPGSTIAVEQAIYAVVTKSANDVAVVIAEHLAGSEDRFAAAMTARAHAIGMTRTQFRNASGLPNKNQLSTARDMAILGKRLMTEFPEQFGYFSRTEFPFRGVMIKGHNHLLENYDGADGIKTGYTAASGFNLVASARHGDQRLITVVFGGTSARARDEHVASLMDAGFTVLAQRPDAIAVAQAVDPFPTAPAMQVAAAPAVSGQSDEDMGYASAGDVDDAIARQIATDEPAPPLAEIAALVPAPAAKKGKAPARTAARKPSVALDPPAATATWGIQVGAYMNRLQAETHATAAAGKVRAAFEGASPRVVPVKLKPTKVLYRAQVIGLGPKDAAKACKLAGMAGKGACKSVAPDQKRVASR